MEIGGPLFELREILHALEPPLGAEQSLNVDAPQCGRVETMPVLLGTNVPHQMSGAVGVSVHVAVEAGDTQARSGGAPVFRAVELLLGERRYEQTQSFELLGIEEAVEKLMSVVACYDFALRDVARSGLVVR